MKRAARSFTLIEVMIAGALLVSVLSLALGLFNNYSNVVRDGVATTDLEMRVSRLESLLRSELQSVQAGSVVLSDPNAVGFFTRIDFRRVTGFDAGTNTVRVTVRRRLDFELEPGETRSNASQDGDRYIDEGLLVLYEDRDDDGVFAPSERVVIATLVASDQEEYVAGLGNVGIGWGFALASGGATPVSTDTSLNVNGCLLGPDPVRATGVRLRTVALRFALRNA